MSDDYIFKGMGETALRFAAQADSYEEKQEWTTIAQLTFEVGAIWEAMQAGRSIAERVDQFRSRVPGP